ncbi:zinc finger MYM-type protein 5-like [Anastrepha obliqua]|uniref:zinc finger MYM-type protein 5-like n=1 Tax=Anastrepha obliqua TaxID=95512 RepID=UPI00240A7727|nr:zinc finger MYM-type protein 5-like [Anastrepha obliqua]
MSDGGQRLSGHAYKKRALEKNNKEKEVLNKTPKLHNCFTKKHGTEEKAGPEKDCLVLENKDDNDVTVKFLSNISLFHPDASTKEKEEIKNLATSDETTDIKSNEKMMNDDPGTWIISDFIRDYVAENGCSQNKNLDFSITERVYSDGKARKLTETLFERKLLNGEKVQRPWLSYSASKKSVYCVTCLLFDADWRHGGARLAEHGNSKNHIKNMTILKYEKSDVIAFKVMCKNFIS